MNNEESQHATLSDVPDGYRSAIVTAITVFLGFSLYFLRWWGVENRDPWTRWGVVAAVTLGVGIVAQLFALFRSLRLADNNRKSYSITVRCFLASVVITVGAVLAAIVIAA